MDKPFIAAADRSDSKENRLSGGLLIGRSIEVEGPSIEKNHIFCSAPIFHHMLRIERKRTERSGVPFLLLLIDISGLQNENQGGALPDRIKEILFSCSRETDINGWYEESRIMGSILTEMISFSKSSVDSILSKLREKFGKTLGAEPAKKIVISFHIFPERQESSKSDNGIFNTALYPDLSEPGASGQTRSQAKKIIDIVGSLSALILLFPFFVIIAAAVKLTSKGPVFFKQERMGLNGRLFTFLKFRSMYTNCDSDRHREYIKKYIGEGKDDKDAPGVYKICNDPRVTPLGRLLRKTSLDELPQFINVLKGEMSLVGPRPPIPYEIKHYDIWHRRRLLSVKPGITGLWQVTGRSRTTFDEMVRLDLRYVREWSLWLDFKLLLMTPWVILTGKGGY